MKKLTALILAVFIGATGWGAAAELDIAVLQAKLAAQEAVLNDIQAKIESENGGAPEYFTSLRKNAKVTIGGLITTGYFYNHGSVDTDAGAGYQRTTNASIGDFQVSDGELEVEINVSENFDAYFNFDLHAQSDLSNGLAQSAWFRWKNIADTGFGLKVGRDDLVFGDSDATFGYLYNFASSIGDGINWWWEDPNEMLPRQNMWDDIYSVTQLAPYWELMDGKLLLEASFFAHAWNDEGAWRDGSDTLITTITATGERIHSRNYGLGSMSFRATWNPTENLHFSASAVNYHSNGIEGWDADTDKLAKNNTAVALSFTWNPACFSALTVWSQYVHGWNVNHFDGADSDAVNFGVSYDFTEKLSVFAQGDYLRYDYEDRVQDTYGKRAWASYIGASYDIGNGVSFEAGWRHENMKTLFEGALNQKDRIKNDMLYSVLSFEF